MMPLSLADIGTETTIKRIGGSPEVKKHLENLGFVVGGTVTIDTGFRAGSGSNGAATQRIETR